MTERRYEPLEGLGCCLWEADKGENDSCLQERQAVVGFGAGYRQRYQSLKNQTHARAEDHSAHM